MQLVYFSLCCAGLTQILVYGKIFDKIRPKEGRLGELLSCPMCTGFWSGLFLWAANGFTELFKFDYSPVTGLFLGCLGSLVSYIFAMAIDDHGIKLDINKE
tara:strand:- start:107 stop:409 length:303 start_codon:yes stop_codon:yes gene_type:complete